MATENGTPKPITHYTDIPGWFHWYDRALFDALLRSQETAGNLVELGAYLGRSAVVVGDHLRPGEEFLVIDLFGADADEAANKAENDRFYKTLSRQEFESNYLALHETLPDVVQGPSAVVVEHVAPASVRFLHIDASHLYEHVAQDIRNARTIIQPDGVVVLDDYRSAHTPGVAAATWAAVANDGLRPFAVTPNKLYATWGDADALRDVIETMIQHDERVGRNVHEALGHTFLQLYTVKQPTAPKPAAAKSAAPKPAAPKPAAPKPAAPKPATTPRPAAPLTTWGRAKRTIARDIAPPALTRWVRKRRR
jgi:hypothetical protein